MKAVALLLDWAVIALIAVLLAACSTPVPRVELIQSQTLMLVEPDPQYLGDCGLVVPPDRDTYKAMGSDERDDAMTRLLLQQMSLTQTCAQDKRSLRALVDKQRQIVNQHNAIEAERVSKLKQALENSP